MNGYLHLQNTIAQLQAGLPIVTQTESVPLSAALNRVLAADITASLDLPGADNAAMDGYALHTADCFLGRRLTCLGQVQAGALPATALPPGTCLRVMTGAPLPAGADTVVPQEDVAIHGQQIELLRPPRPQAHVRRRGEHVRTHDTLLTAGRRLDEAAIGLAAAAGISHLPVTRRLRVAILSTGNELTDPPQPLREGHSYDANRPLLQSLCMRLGLDVLDLGLHPDTDHALQAALAQAHAQHANVVLTTGGTAQGDADLLRRHPGLRFVDLNIKPGRGLIVGTPTGIETPLPLIGLPGNPVAAFVMFHLAARPLLLHLAGSREPMPTPLWLPLAHEVTVTGPRMDCRRARLVNRENTTAVECLQEQGSAMLRSLLAADALVMLNSEAAYQCGDAVPALALK
jgi:molybdopterin molybdotransferase